MYGSVSAPASNIRLPMVLGKNARVVERGNIHHSTVNSGKRLLTRGLVRDFNASNITFLYPVFSLFLDVLTPC